MIRRGGGDEFGLAMVPRSLYVPWDINRVILIGVLLLLLFLWFLAVWRVELPNSPLTILSGVLTNFIYTIGRTRSCTSVSGIKNICLYQIKC